MPASSVILKATGVSKNFGGLQVLSDVNFAIAAQEAVGIVGPNGAGKTTLLSIVVGAQAPTTGTLRFEGEDITRLETPERCRKGIVRTHQVPRPFLGMTIFENVLTAAAHGGGFRGAQASERALDALQVSGMLHLANRKAETLGLMDRKRLELARALATDPSLLLLDEIGGGLTDGEAQDLVAIIQRVRQGGVAIIWIEHIVHILLQVAERLICMDAGRVIADGDPRTVMSDPAVVAAYLGGGAG
jgi:branched-chain amino acid transport system ATP-binding protein